MNSYLKKVCLLASATVLSACLLTGFEKYPEKKDYTVTVEGSIFGGQPDDRIEAMVSFDPEWLTQEDNTKYNKDLAAFSAILSADTYFRTKDLEKGKQNRVLYEGEDEESYTWTSFLEQVGFDSTEYVESYKVQQKETDQNDTVTMVLAHGVVDDQYDAYVVAVRGCFSMGEWKSAFDLGNDGDDYKAITGEHPEWTDADIFKSYDVAKNRALELIDAFIEETGDDSREDCILVTGHSRGGALANLIGAEMENREGVKPFTYTFNTPAISMQSDAGKYQTVFNIFDSGDLFTDMYPFSEESAYRNGKELSCSIEESEEIKTEINAFVGREDYHCLSADDRNEYKKLFGAYFPNRTSLYEKKNIEKVYDTKEAAEDGFAACKSIISTEEGLGLENVCVLTDIMENADAKYAFSLEYSGAAVLTCEAETLAMGKMAADAACQLLQEDEGACQILTFLTEHAGDASGGHRLANSFILTKYIDIVEEEK